MQLQRRARVLSESADPYYFYCHHSFTLYKSFGREFLQSFVVVQPSGFVALQAAGGSAANGLMGQHVQVTQQEQAEHRAELCYRQRRC